MCSVTKNSAPVFSGVPKTDQWEFESYVITVLRKGLGLEGWASSALLYMLLLLLLLICPGKNTGKWKQVFVLVGGLTIRNRSALSAWNREWTTRQHRTAGRETPGAPGEAKLTQHRWWSDPLETLRESCTTTRLLFSTDLLFVSDSSWIRWQMCPWSSQR